MWKFFYFLRTCFLCRSLHLQMYFLFGGQAGKSCREGGRAARAGHDDEGGRAGDTAQRGQVRECFHSPSTQQRDSEGFSSQKQEGLFLYIC